MGAFEECRLRGTCRVLVRRVRLRLFVRGEPRTTPRTRRGKLDVGQERPRYIVRCRRQTVCEDHLRVPDTSVSLKSFRYRYLTLRCKFGIFSIPVPDTLVSSALF